jgi:hypothetical protein
VTADAPNVGATVRGGTNTPRILCRHADLFAAYADGVMIDAGLTGEAYLSHYAFGPDYVTHHAANRGSVAGFAGPSWCRHLVLDIDRDRPDDALADARRLVTFLHNRYPELEGTLPIYFSGSKGYHVLLDLAHRPPPSPTFHRVAKVLAVGLARTAGVKIDPSVYDIAHIIRLPNTRHPKSGLYKRRTDADDLFRLDVDAVRKHAAHPAGDGLPSADATPEQLVTDWADAAARTDAEQLAARSAHTTDDRAPKYLIDLLRFGVDEGERHQTLFRCAAWLTEMDAPPSLVHALLTEPGLDVGLTPKDVTRQIECGIDHADRQRAARTTTTTNEGGTT